MKSKIMTILLFVGLGIQGIARSMQQPMQLAKSFVLQYPKAALALGMAAAWCGGIAAMPSQEIRWPKYDWTKIELLGAAFPKEFQWGAATSAYQTEGNQGPCGKTIESSWTEFEKKSNGKIVPAGHATGHWDRYEEDIKLLAQMGLNTFRFSISWSTVQPEEGHFDQDALEHYKDVVTTCKRYGVEPVITLFHHTWPVWFGNKGGFEKKENIADFVTFGKTMFDLLHPVGAKYWMPLNEPSGYAMAGFIDGRYPPNKRLHFKTCGIWLKNILDAHTQLYVYYKGKDQDVQVGIATVVMPMDPYNRYNPFDHMACSLVDRLLNEVALEYLTTGNYCWNPPFASVGGKNKAARGALDFIGINYYSHKHLRWFKEAKPAYVTTDKEIYPEGLHRAIEYCWDFANRECFANRDGCHIPLIITENGISVQDDNDATRTEYIVRHLHVVQQAIGQGYDIRGYHWWTLTDNYNWAQGFKSKYGLYAIDFNDDKKPRTFKPSAQVLKDVVKDWSSYHYPTTSSCFNYLV